MEKSNTIIYDDIESRNNEIDSILFEAEDYYEDNCLNLRRFIPKGWVSVIIPMKAIDSQLSYSISQNRCKLDSCKIEDLKKSCMYNISNGQVYKDKVLGFPLIKDIIRGVMDSKGQMHLAPKFESKTVDLETNCVIFNIRTIKREFYD